MIRESIYLHYLNALLEGNKETCARIVLELMENDTDLKTLYVDLFQRSMYQIGRMWEKCRCNVANEHLATKITESMINLVYSQILDLPKNGKKVIISCVDKEFHELGPKMVADYFELNGWRSYFLGSNTPVGELLRLIEEKKPDVLGISGSFYINIARLMRTIAKVRESFPDLKILVGGQALAEENSNILDKYDNVHYIPSLDALDDFLIDKNKLN